MPKQPSSPEFISELARRKYTADDIKTEGEAASEQQAPVGEEAAHSRTGMVLWLDTD